MSQTEYDFIIVGTGAAGLSAAQYASRANMRTLVLDQGLPGGQISNIYTLENYPGVFPAVNGMDFIDNMTKQAKAFGAVIEQRNVSFIEKKDDVFYVSAGDEQFLASALCLATGAEHRKLGVPGEKELEGRGVSYCATCDGPFFRNKDVVVVGGGDSACSEAIYLAELCSHVTVVHRKSQFRAQKAVAQSVLSNPKITVCFNSNVTKIMGEKKVTSVEITNSISGEKTEKETSAVFIFVGMLPRTSLYSSLQFDEAGYIVTNENMETSVKGLYAAGDVRSKSFRQIITACADGAIASHSAEEYIRSLRGEEYK